MIPDDVAVDDVIHLAFPADKHLSLIGASEHH